MNVDRLRDIIINKQPFKNFGFNLKYVRSGLNPLGNYFSDLESDTVNNRNISINISEILKNDNIVFLVLIRIKKTTRLEMDEDASFLLNDWLREKKYEFDINSFCIHRNNDIEYQCDALFRLVDEIFLIEELSKIIRGEYWEIKTTYWGMFGR